MASRARRRIRGAPTKLTEAELARYRSTVYGMAAAVGRVPRMSFGRDRYAMAASAAQVLLRSPLHVLVLSI